jgi:ribosome recycling factor
MSERRVTVEGSLKDASQKMKSAISVLREEFGGIRSGRATPAILSRINVDYYGSQVPLNQLASFSVPEPRLLVIQPFDKNAISAMEKAIQSSDLGLTPSNDGNVIRLSFPQLTEERRKDLIRMVHQRAEEARVAVRNVRRHHKDELEQLEREHAISEDELRRAEKELQKVTDQHVSEIDDVLGHKEKELTEV